MNVRSIRVFLVSAIAIGMVAGMGQASAQTKIRMSYVLAPVFLAPLIFSLDDTILKHHGKSYTIDLIKFRGTPQTLTALAAGEVDVGGLAFSTFGAAVVNARQDIRALFDIAQDGVNFSVPFVVLQDSPIKTVKDLKGKVLSINAKGAGVDMGARAVLFQHGLRPERDVTIIEARFPAQEAMLRQGKADIVVLPAPFWAKAQRKGGVRALFRQKDGLGVAQFLFYVAKTDYIKKNRAALVDMTEDYVRGMHWLLNPANRDKAINVLAKFTKRKARIYKSWVFLKGKGIDHSPDGRLNVAALQRNVDILKKFGILRRSFDVKEYVDHSVLDDALARIK